ncbi:MAG: fibronectin type III domain-containing protein [bacterium]|nr:fibronectin type III domain-containing protein [bacterium]
MIKTVIFFATFFAFFLFFAPLAQADDSECVHYTDSGSRYATLSECSSAGWDSCIDVGIDESVYAGYYKDNTYAGNSCTVDATSAAGTCDGSSGNCVATPVTPACSSNADCNDNSNCSTDTCNNPGTASAACSYGAACSAGQVCNTGIPKPYACVTPACSSNADCNDNSNCSTDTCNNPGTASAACSYGAACGVGQVCNTNIPAPYACVTSDATAPTPGNSGTITTASIAATTLTLNWTKATDNVTAQASIVYRVDLSTSNNIGTVANAEANGTPIQAYTADINTFNVTGLSPGTTYYFNVIAKDGAGNKAVYTTKSEATATLTFPTGTWQRLWYTDPKTNDFSAASYLGEGPGSNDKNGNPPNVTSETFVTDWGDKQLYNTTVAGTDNGKDKIGFKASRTLTGLTPGSYIISLGADDGIKLFVNGGGNLLPSTAWTDNHSYNDNRHTALVELSSSATIEIHYRENTGDAQVSFSYALAPVAPAPLPVIIDPSDTAIYVAWNSVSGVSGATYRLEWCKKSVIDGGGSFSSPGCGPPNSPAGGPPYFLTTASTSGYIIGTEPATAYNLRVRVDSGTSVLYVFPGNWASASATTRTPLSCNNVNPTNISGGSSVTNDCFKDERRCGPIDTEAGCTAACSLGDNYLSFGLNPITQIGTITTGKWRVTGSASYDLFAQGHGVECIGPDWRSWISNVNASIYLKYPSPIDTASSSQGLNWTLTGEGGQEFSLPSAATLTFDKVFNCPDASCDLWFYSSFSGNTWAHKQFFPGGGGDYVRQLAVMDNNFSWVRVDETAPGIPTINTLQDQWRKENPVTNVAVTDDIALSEIGYALRGKDCTFPADPCSEADWKKAQKSDLSGDLAISGTSATTDWKISNADWGRFDEGSNTLYLRVKDATGNCRGCDDGTKIQFGVKKDTVAPTSKITVVDDLVRAPRVRLDYPLVGDSSAYLNADNEGDTKKTWWMYVVDADTGSGLNTCSIAINGVAKPDRSCVAGWLTFTVGKDNPATPLPEADCILEGDDYCTIKVWARDTVGNITTTRNVGAASLNKEKDYLEGLVTQDANEFSFSVDWQKPTAQ